MKDIRPRMTEQELTFIREIVSKESNRQEQLRQEFFTMEHKRKMLSRQAVSRMDYETSKQIQTITPELEAKKLEVESRCDYNVFSDCDYLIRRITKIIDGTSIRRTSLYTKTTT